MSTVLELRNPGIKKKGEKKRKERNSAKNERMLLESQLYNLLAKWPSVNYTTSIRQFPRV